MAISLEAPHGGAGAATRAEVRADGTAGGSASQLLCGADCFAHSTTETEDRQCQGGGGARAVPRLTGTEASASGRVTGHSRVTAPCGTLQGVPSRPSACPYWLGVSREVVDSSSLRFLTAAVLAARRKVEERERQSSRTAEGGRKSCRRLPPLAAPFALLYVPLVSGSLWSGVWSSPECSPRSSSIWIW